MRILSLNLENIGPFPEGCLTFMDESSVAKKPPVTIITGENGTGKTIVLDAIRGLLGGVSFSLERNITRKSNFRLVMQVSTEQRVRIETSIFYSNKNAFHPMNTNYNESSGKDFTIKTDNGYWVVDYWTSKLATDQFSVEGLAPPTLNNLSRSLTGIHRNVEVTQLITYFDYLKSSESPDERALGEALYGTLKTIFKLCLNDGELKYVARKTLEPVVEQNGREVTLEKLSSGNLYLVQRMVSMLGKMYAVNVLNSKPLEELCQAPGLLLIDEAENHLHPKWQKTFINNILTVFPNLQIILTTHSPFIVASVENARIYVCESRTDHSVIVDQTDEYANKPIDEILLTPLFDTQPFNEKISDLIAARKKAITEGDKAKRKAIEEKLQAINPEYFSYFDVEELLDNMADQV